MEHPGSFPRYLWQNGIWSLYVTVKAPIGMVFSAVLLPQPWAAVFCFMFGLFLGCGLVLILGWHRLYKRRLELIEQDKEFRRSLIDRLGMPPELVNFMADMINADKTHVAAYAALEYFKEKE